MRWFADAGSVSSRRRQESNPPDGMTRPTRFEDEGGHQTPFTSGVRSTTRLSSPLPPRSPAHTMSAPGRRKGDVMKKLLVILILIAIGVAVAKKVRDTA